jgi:DNA-directed RNA polymerase subunit RPC12/RpoP
MINTEEKWFPCPVCLRLLDVRTSKRKKPYVICSPCGVQMFIRERAGIEAFEALVEQGRKDNVLARVAELERRCRLRCPQCSKSFWLSPELIITNRLTGSVTGYRCSQKNCRGIVPLDAPSEVTGENGKERNAPGSLASQLGKLIK